MNLGIICDINSKIPIGAIAVDNQTGTVGYISSNEDLDKIIDIILDNDELEIPIKEKINDAEIMRNEKITLNNPNYLMAFNYYLPLPWRILGIRYADGDMENILEETYNYMGV